MSLHCVKVSKMFNSVVRSLFLDDKDDLAAKRTDLIKTMLKCGDRRVAGRPKAQSQLQYSTGEKDGVPDSSSLTLLANVDSNITAATPLISNKRPYEDIEQVCLDLDN